VIAYVNKGLSFVQKRFHPMERGMLHLNLGDNAFLPISLL
jgi:hypothetical protein